MKKVLVLAAVAMALGFNAWGAETILNPTADSPVFGLYPSGNYGSQTYGYWGYFNYPMRTLVKYDCSTLSGSVTGVKLSFQLMQNNWSGTQIWACKLLGDWQEMTVTYGNQPSHDDTAAGRFLDTVAPAGTGIHTLNCTTAANTIVQAWMSTPASNYGIILRTQNEGGNLRAYPYMKESSNQPVRLVVETATGVAPASLGRIKSLYN